MQSQPTFNAIIKLNATTHGDETAYVFLKQGEEADRLTFKDLYWESLWTAQKLLNDNPPGSRIILAFPPGLNFIIAFCACLLSGMVAVPCVPPRSQREREKFLKIIADSQCSAALTDASITTLISRLESDAGILKKLSILERKNTYTSLPNTLPEVLPEHLAMIQYTSGSTGEPKGVMLSHYNLIYNQQCIKEAFGHHAATTVVSWLPHYHDMGLIGNILQPLYLGRPSILMSPNDFIQKPLLWLQAISKYKATTSGAPCFAYDLCVKKINALNKEELDLSTLEVAYIGSEPVIDSVLKEFETHFKENGFRPKAFLPCYGLAESTLLVTGSKGHIKIHNGERKLISNGKPYGVELKIVDEKTQAEMEEGGIGEVWITGPSVATGYWNKPAITRDLFEARLAKPDGKAYLRTGDLGFIKDGELYIAGRLKSMIIIRGVNYFSEDIELALQNNFLFLKKFGGAAFSIQSESGEKLIIVHEVEKGFMGQIAIKELLEQMQECIVKNFGIVPENIALVPEGMIPRTSSGKIRRDKCREKYVLNELRLLKETN